MGSKAIFRTRKCLLGLVDTPILSSSSTFQHGKYGLKVEPRIVVEQILSDCSSEKENHSVNLNMKVQSFGNGSLQRPAHLISLPHCGIGRNEFGMPLGAKYLLQSVRRASTSSRQPKLNSEDETSEDQNQKNGASPEDCDQVVEGLSIAKAYKLHLKTGPPSVVVNPSRVLFGRMKPEEVAAVTSSSLPDEVVDTLGPIQWEVKKEGKKEKAKQDKEEREMLKELEAATEELPMKEMTEATAREELTQAIHHYEKDPCNTSRALPALPTFSSINKEHQEFSSLLDQELNLYNYILEKEGVEDEEPKRAYGFAKEVSDRSEWINKVDAKIHQESRNAFEESDTQIQTRWHFPYRHPTAPLWQRRAMAHLYPRVLRPSVLPCCKAFEGHGTHTMVPKQTEAIVEELMSNAGIDWGRYISGNIISCQGITISIKEISLKEFADTHEIFETRMIYGDEDDDCYTFVRDDRKGIVKQLIDAISEIHTTGVCLKVLLPENIVVTGNGLYAKLTNIVLVCATPELKNSNFVSLHNILQDVLFHNKPLPFDMNHLMNLMKTKALKSIYLMKHHSALWPQASKTALFQLMFDRINILRFQHPKKYWRLLDKLTDGKIWRSKVSKNRFLVLSFTRGDGYDTKEDPQIFLMFYRNTSYHKMDRCCDPTAEKKDEMYTLEMVQDILDSTFAEVLPEMQELLYKEGQLHRACLHVVMPEYYTVG